jgi:hypothetical protein
MIICFILDSVLKLNDLTAFPEYLYDSPLDI